MREAHPPTEDEAVTPKDAACVVRMETNSAYNPAISTEEVAEELEISVDRAFALLDEGTRPRAKPVGGTHIWWW